MEHLFNTMITIDGEEKRFLVVFDQEKYVFQPEDEKSYSRFSLVREHDEWHGQEKLSPEIQKQATEALDRYLLQQH